MYFLTTRCNKLLDVGRQQRLTENRNCQRGSRKTVVTLHHSQFGSTPTPFELKNAPGTFQRSIDVQMTVVKWHLVMIDLDVIVIFSQTQTMKSIMYDKYRLYRETLASRWICKYASSSPNASISSVTLFSQGASKCRHGQLRKYTEFDSRWAWLNFDDLLASAAYFADLYRISSTSEPY